jgi:hypothetical protein
MVDDAEDVRASRQLLLVGIEPGWTYNAPNAPYFNARDPLLAALLLLLEKEGLSRALLNVLQPEGASNVDPSLAEGALVLLQALLSLMRPVLPIEMVRSLNQSLDRAVATLLARRDPVVSALISRSLPATASVAAVPVIAAATAQPVASPALSLSSRINATRVLISPQDYQLWNLHACLDVVSAAMAAATTSSGSGSAEKDARKFIATLVTFFRPDGPEGGYRHVSRRDATPALSELGLALLQAVLRLPPLNIREWLAETKLHASLVTFLENALREKDGGLAAMSATMSGDYLRWLAVLTEHQGAAFVLANDTRLYPRLEAALHVVTLESETSARLVLASLNFPDLLAASGDSASATVARQATEALAAFLQAIARHALPMVALGALALLFRAFESHLTPPQRVDAVAAACSILLAESTPAEAREAAAALVYPVVTAPGGWALLRAAAPSLPREWPVDRVQSFLCAGFTASVEADASTPEDTMMLALLEENAERALRDIAADAHGAADSAISGTVRDALGVVDDSGAGSGSDGASGAAGGAGAAAGSGELSSVAARRLGLMRPQLLASISATPWGLELLERCGVVSALCGILNDPDADRTWARVPAALLGLGFVASTDAGAAAVGSAAIEKIARLAAAATSTAGGLCATPTSRSATPPERAAHTAPFALFALSLIARSQLGREAITSVGYYLRCDSYMDPTGQLVRVAIAVPPTLTPNNHQHRGRSPSSPPVVDGTAAPGPAVVPIGALSVPPALRPASPPPTGPAVPATTGARRAGGHPRAAHRGEGPARLRRFPLATLAIAAFDVPKLREALAGCIKTAALGAPAAISPVHTSSDGTGTPSSARDGSPATAMSAAGGATVSPVSTPPGAPALGRNGAGSPAAAPLTGDGAASATAAGLELLRADAAGTADVAWFLHEFPVQPEARMLLAQTFFGTAPTIAGIEVK